MRLIDMNCIIMTQCNTSDAKTGLQWKYFAMISICKFSSLGRASDMKTDGCGFESVSWQDFFYLLAEQRLPSLLIMLNFMHASSFQVFKFKKSISILILRD